MKHMELLSRIPKRLSGDLSDEPLQSSCFKLKPYHTHQSPKVSDTKNAGTEPFWNFLRVGFPLHKPLIHLLLWKRIHPPTPQLLSPPIPSTATPGSFLRLIKEIKELQASSPGLAEVGRGRHQWGGMGPTLGEHYSLSQGWAQKTIYKYLENIGTYHLFRQLWLLLGVKLMEINSNLFSRYGLYNFTFWGGFFPSLPSYLSAMKIGGPHVNSIEITIGSGPFIVYGH